MRTKKKSLTAFLVTFACLWPALGQPHNDDDDCLDVASRVLETNSPEFMMIQDDAFLAESNSFTSSRLRVVFTWSHIDALLNKARQWRMSLRETC